MFPSSTSGPQKPAAYRNGASMIRFKCSTCGAPKQALDNKAGMKGKCACGAIYTIPAILGDVTSDLTDIAAAQTPNPTSHQVDESKVVSVKIVDHPRRGSSMGIASIVLGVLGLLICWIPIFGALGIPLSGLGLILGVGGFVVAFRRQGSGIGFPITGIAISGLALAIAVSLAMLLAHGVEKLRQTGVQSHEVERTSSSTSPIEKPALPISNVHKEGEVVTLGYMSYLIKTSWWTEVLSDNPFLQKPADAAYLVVALAVQSNSRTPSMMPPFRLIDEHDNEYEPTSKALLLDKVINGMERLNPGVPQIGFVVFDVPKNRKYKLKVSGGLISGANANIELAPKPTRESALAAWAEETRSPATTQPTPRESSPVSEKPTQEENPTLPKSRQKGVEPPNAISTEAEQSRAKPSTKQAMQSEPGSAAISPMNKDNSPALPSSGKTGATIVDGSHSTWNVRIIENRDPDRRRLQDEILTQKRIVAEFPKAIEEEIAIYQKVSNEYEATKGNARGPTVLLDSVESHKRDVDSKKKNFERAKSKLADLLKSREELDTVRVVWGRSERGSDVKLIGRGKAMNVAKSFKEGETYSVSGVIRVMNNAFEITLDTGETGTAKAPDQQPVANEAKERLTLGQNYQKAGKNDLARQAYREVLRRFPDSMQAKEAQKSLEALPSEEPPVGEEKSD